MVWLHWLDYFISKVVDLEFRICFIIKASTFSLGRDGKCYKNQDNFN